jgi:hypothetical protein
LERNLVHDSGGPSLGLTVVQEPTLSDFRLVLRGDLDVCR